VNGKQMYRSNHWLLEKVSGPNRLAHVHKRKVGSAIVMLMIAVVLMMSACESSTKIAVDNGNPPTFKFSGSGRFLNVYVAEVPPGGDVDICI